MNQRPVVARVKQKTDPHTSRAPSPAPRNRSADRSSERRLNITELERSASSSGPPPLPIPGDGAPSTEVSEEGGVLSGMGSEKVGKMFAIGAGSGFLAGVFGVGGGILTVPSVSLATDLGHKEVRSRVSGLGTRTPREGGKETNRIQTLLNQPKTCQTINNSKPNQANIGQGETKQKKTKPNQTKRKETKRKRV